MNLRTRSFSVAFCARCIQARTWGGRPCFLLRIQLLISSQYSSSSSVFVALPIMV